MSDLSRNAAFDNVDDLLNATMDDIDELPPLAIPPTGNYTVKISIDRKEVNGKDALITSYVVVEIGEVADEAEASEVVVGQQWQNGCYVKKSDGKPNETGIAMFKTSIVPFAQHFFPDNWKQVTIGEITGKVQETLANLSLRRVLRKGGADDDYNFRVKSLIVL
jgi:hypothetical protein